MKRSDKILMVSITKLDDIVIDTIKKQTQKECVELYRFKRPTPVSAIKRHLICMVIAFKAVPLRKKYSYLIFWQQFIGLYYNLFCYLLFIRNFPKAMILTVIFIKRFNFFGKCHRFLYNLAFRSRYVNKMVCHSSTERNYYLSEFGKDLKDRIVFCKLGEGLVVSDLNNSSEKRYFFSGGGSNRDYETLIKAFQGLDEELIIACRPDNIGNYEIPSNVTIKHNTYGDDFSNLMRKAYSIILPISDPNISSGQLVLLNAMKYGKSSIVTTGNCMADYVDRKYTIEVSAKSVKELRDAVILLSKNPGLNKRMSVNAYNYYCKNFSIDRYAEEIADLVKN
jgi:glycosyltransferase involved in cell wall biosynthesis